MHNGRSGSEADVAEMHLGICPDKESLKLIQAGEKLQLWFTDIVYQKHEQDFYCSNQGSLK